MEKRIFNRDRPSRGGYGGSRDSGNRDGGRSGGFGASRERSFSRGPRDDFRPKSAYGTDRPPFGGTDRPPFGDRGSRGAPRTPPVISMQLINGGLPPKAMTPGSSGMDVYANSRTLIGSKQFADVTTGVVITGLPGETAVKVRNRSSSAQQGLLLIYPTSLTNENREFILTFYNLSESPIEINIGDRVAQIICLLTKKVMMEVGESFSETKRNTGGFGSTNENTKKPDYKRKIEETEEEETEEEETEEEI